MSNIADGQDDCLVLVVDDDTSIRYMVCETLRSSGFAVAEAVNGREGFNAFQKLNPDVVLLDIEMPEEDGLSVCAKIRQINGQLHVPVLMITVADDPASIGRAYEAGATDFLAKPINWLTLAHHLRYLLRASKAIEAAVAAEKKKSEFLANMSHEIRTPMNGVIGMLRLLKQSKLSKKQQHYLSLASSCADSLLLLINDILDFSKIEAGKLAKEILDFNLRDLLGECAEAMAHPAQEKGLEVILDVSRIDKTMVRGDPSRIRQILYNLISNAIKFTEQGEIIIKARLEQIDNNNMMLRCSVSDSGIGIPEDKIDSLFNSFTQVDASTTRKYGGTGLGLAIVKLLCKLFDGDITVTSKQEEGSKFEFTIALEVSRQAEAVVPNVDVSNTHILIVDDSRANRKALRKQLELWGAMVSEARDGPSALRVLSQNEDKPFDVVIMDKQMQGIDGISLGEAIRADNSLGTVKLIMMTSIGDPGDARYFDKLGVQGYFPKPVTTSDLFAALAMMIDDETFACAESLPASQNIGNLERQTIAEGTRVLLVEDNLINQVIAQKVLSNFGVVTDTACNGLEALRKLGNSPNDVTYSLILMDCQMPVLDGYEASKKIRQADALFCDIPIIALTANAMHGDREKCIDAGMNDYLSKPVNATELEEKLLYWLNPVSRDIDDI